MLKTLGWVFVGVIAAVAYVVFKPPVAVIWVVLLCIFVWLYEKEQAFQKLRSRVEDLEANTADATSELSDNVEGLRKRVLALEETGDTYGEH